MALSISTEMKLKYYLLLLCLSTIVLAVDSQIILGNFDSAIPCCSFEHVPPYIDSFDINTDSIPDFWILTQIGFDDLSYLGYSSSSTELNEPLPYGESYTKDKWNHGAYGLPGTYFFGGWGVWWMPNTGNRYLGIRKINSIADTTYGWIKLDFRGDTIDPFLDTLFVLGYGYNAISNVPLYGGQTIATSIDESVSNEQYKVFPNPFTSYLNFDNGSLSPLSISLFDLTGKILMSWRLPPESQQEIFTNSLESGMYLLNIKSSSVQKSYKIIKQ